MFNRVVSFASLMLVIASVMFFLVSTWWVASGQIDVGNGILSMGGWLLGAIVFSYRHADPAWLDPISIVKSR
jgi:Na+/phosphate symporter